MVLPGEGIIAYADLLLHCNHKTDSKSEGPQDFSLFANTY
jgi:hypothetical protein